MNLVTTRTITAILTNDREGVVRELDSLGCSGSKIWNVARWTISRIWDHTGEIPDEGPLKSYMKTQDCWKDLNAQSSQAIVEELSGAFQSWFQQDDPDANPPGYRKHGDQRPRSTIIFKEDGFKLDTKHQQVRLSKGKNLKDGWADFILCEYDTGPDASLAGVEDVQQVRAVWTGDHWELHFVCKVTIDVPDHSSEKTAGVDLGICNTAAVSVGDETVLYPGNERGLYVCSDCGLVANSDLNAAENMRATVTPNPSQDRSNGCLAQPTVRLFDKQTGRVAPQEQVRP